MGERFPLGRTFPSATSDIVRLFVSFISRGVTFVMGSRRRRRGVIPALKSIVTRLSINTLFAEEDLS